MENLQTKKPFFVGLTGSIGSGKTQVAEQLKELGCACIDADQLARDVVAPGAPTLELLRQEFGPDIFNSDLSLNRSALGKIVFNCASKKQKLESILHPLIRARFLEHYQQFLQNPPANGIVICVIPLLFEARAASSQPVYTEITYTITVSADQEIIVDRIMQRDNCSQELAQKKLSSQMPQAEKEKHADYILYNNASLAELQEKVRKLYQKLLRLSEGSVKA